MDVTVYHTTNCPFCKVEMQWLDSKDISYTHKNVQENSEYMAEFQNLNVGSAVPITKIKNGKNGDEIIRGFDRIKLSSALSI